MRACGKAILSCPRVALCAAIITVIATVSAQGQYRLVQGRIVPRNSPDWTIISDRIEVIGFSGGALLCRTFTEADVDVGSGATRGNMRFAPNMQRVKTYKDTFALTNYPGAGSFKRGDVIRPPISVMRVSAYVAHSGSDIGVRRVSYGHDLYDYGLDYTPPPRQLTPEEAAAAKKEAEKRKSETKDKTLEWHQDQADKGNAYGQYRMGLRYLKGDGVPSDRAKAIDYLSKAAAQGNEEAQKELRKLATGAPPPQTNSGSSGLNGRPLEGSGQDLRRNTSVTFSAAAASI
jgi:Sel1 repeat